MAYPKDVIAMLKDAGVPEDAIRMSSDAGLDPSTLFGSGPGSEESKPLSALPAGLDPPTSPSDVPPPLIAKPRQPSIPFISPENAAQSLAERPPQPPGTLEKSGMAALGVAGDVWDTGMAIGEAASEMVPGGRTAFTNLRKSGNALLWSLDKMDQGIARPLRGMAYGLAPTRSLRQKGESGYDTALRLSKKKGWTSAGDATGLVTEPFAEAWKALAGEEDRSGWDIWDAWTQSAAAQSMRGESGKQMTPEERIKTLFAMRNPGDRYDDSIGSTAKAYARGAGGLALQVADPLMLGMGSVNQPLKLGRAAKMFKAAGEVLPDVISTRKALVPAVKGASEAATAAVQAARSTSGNIAGRAGNWLVSQGAKAGRGVGKILGAISGDAGMNLGQARDLLKLAGQLPDEALKAGMTAKQSAKAAVAAGFKLPYSTADKIAKGHHALLTAHAPFGIGEKVLIRGEGAARKLGSLVEAAKQNVVTGNIYKLFNQTVRRPGGRLSPEIGQAYDETKRLYQGPSLASGIDDVGRHLDEALTKSEALSLRRKGDIPLAERMANASAHVEAPSAKVLKRAKRGGVILEPTKVKRGPILMTGESAQDALLAASASEGRGLATRLDKRLEGLRKMLKKDVRPDGYMSMLTKRVDQEITDIAIPLLGDTAEGRKIYAMVENPKIPIAKRTRLFQDYLSRQSTEAAEDAVELRKQYKLLKAEMTKKIDALADLPFNDRVKKGSEIAHAFHIEEITELALQQETQASTYTKHLADLNKRLLGKGARPINLNDVIDPASLDIIARKRLTGKVVEQVQAEAMSMMDYTIARKVKPAAPELVDMADIAGRKSDGSRLMALGKVPESSTAASIARAKEKVPGANLHRVTPPGAPILKKTKIGDLDIGPLYDSVPRPEKVPGEKAIADIYGGKLKIWEKMETDRGILRRLFTPDDGNAYMPHVETDWKRAFDKAKRAGKVKGIKGVNPSKGTHQFHKARSTQDVFDELGFKRPWNELTVDEVNKHMSKHFPEWFDETKPFFETDIHTIVARRGIAAVTASNTVDFMDDVTKQFGRDLPALRRELGLPKALKGSDLEGALNHAGFSKMPVLEWRVPIGGSKRMVPDVWMPSELVDDVTTMISIAKEPPEIQMVKNFFGRSMMWMRGQALFSARYHMRNRFSDLINGRLGGLPFHEAPEYYGKQIALQLGEDFILDTPQYGKLTAKRIREVEQKLGVMGGGQTAWELDRLNLTQLLKSGGKKNYKNPLRLDWAGFDANRRFGQFWENSGRGALFMKRLTLGDSFMDAWRGVNRVFFDYSDLTKMEKTIAKPMSYFWTFQKKNLWLQMGAMVTQPDMFQSINHARKTFDEYFKNYDGPIDGRKFVQGWVKNGLPLTLGVDPKTKQQRVLLFGSWAPVNDAAKVLLPLALLGESALAAIQGDGKKAKRKAVRVLWESLQTVAGLANPAIKMIFSSLHPQGYDLFYQGPVERVPGEQTEFLGIMMSKRLAHSLRQITVLSDTNNLNPPIPGFPEGVWGSKSQESLPSWVTGMAKAFLNDIAGTNLKHSPQKRTQHNDPPLGYRAAKLAGAPVYNVDLKGQKRKYMKWLRKKAVEAKSGVKSLTGGSRADPNIAQAWMKRLMAIAAEMGEPSDKGQLWEEYQDTGGN